MESRKRYCCIKNCANFQGTTDAQVLMFRFPKDEDEKQKWINAIKNYTDRVIGFVCGLHFASTDLQKIKGRTQVKKGAIPFVSTSSMTDVPEETEGQKDCRNCAGLQLDYNELKDKYLKDRLELEMKLLEQSDVIEKLQQKCNDQHILINGYKRKILSLEKTEKEITKNNEDLRDKLLGKLNALNTKDVRQKEIIDCLVNGILPTKKYSEFVRQFALSVHFQSPRAYEYIREVFNNHLPHNSTMRKWYSNSNVDDSPGITKTALNFLIRKVAEKNQTGQKLVCAVCFDEMSMRKQIIWDYNSRQMLGFVTYGSNDRDDPLVANEALVFMVSGLNEKFRIPVGYHFVSKLDATKKAELVKSVLIALIETGVEISSITFDGHPTNKKVCKILGANLDVFSPRFQTFITLNEKRIYIFFDVCHTEKLVRGWFDKIGVFYDNNGDAIKWSYITNLVKYNQEKGFSMMHKLNQKHLDWRRRPMNVRIAVETLSRSTADAIEFLKNDGKKEFAESDATVKFIRHFDDSFDIFNTKVQNNNINNSFKSALNSSNKQVVFERLNEVSEYIKNMTYRQETGEVKTLCRSEARTGFIGFIIDFNSLRSIYEYYVEDTKLLSSIPTYYLNQDAVEMFFGKIRSRGGWNDNPNVIQFKAAYKRLLGNDSIWNSRKGNCESFESNLEPLSDIFTISSRRDKYSAKTEEETEAIVLSELPTLHQTLADINASAKSNLTDDMSKYTISYIANLIEEKIKNSDNCQHCINVFQVCSKVEKAFISSKCTSNPCRSTFNICLETDRFLKLKLLTGNINFDTIYYTIINNIQPDHIFREANFAEHPEHKLYLIKNIIDGYVRIKGLFIARSATQGLQSKILRYKFRKLVHFYGQ